MARPYVRPAILAAGLVEAVREGRLVTPGMKWTWRTRFHEDLPPRAREWVRAEVIRLLGDEEAADLIGESPYRPPVPCRFQRASELSQGVNV